MVTEQGDPIVLAASALAGAAIIASSAVLQAPFLALLAVPIVVGAVLHGRGRRGGLPWLLAGGLLYAGVAVNFVRSSGDFDWATGDYIGILVGGPAAALTAVLAGGRLATRGRSASR